MAGKKVLIIMSDATSFPVHKDNETVDQPTGFFLMELAKPLSIFLRKGYSVTFASPKGSTPVPDPNSESLLAFLGNAAERTRENDLIEAMKRESNLARPTPFRDITDAQLAGYDAVFIPGGHAPLTDLGDDAELGRILMHFHVNRKPTGVICHGPYALLSTKYAGAAGEPAGTFAYKGYRITSWSDAEEKVMETMLGGTIEKVESTLRDVGVEMVEGVGEKVGQITVDREVVSGGNPMAANALGEKMVEMIEARGN